jgi:hypothetical protein
MVLAAGALRLRFGCFCLETSRALFGGKGGRIFSGSPLQQVQLETKIGQGLSAHWQSGRVYVYECVSCSEFALLFRTGRQAASLAATPGLRVSGEISAPPAALQAASKLQDRAGGGAQLAGRRSFEFEFPTGQALPCSANLIPLVKNGRGRPHERIRDRDNPAGWPHHTSFAISRSLNF